MTKCPGLENIYVGQEVSLWDAHLPAIYQNNVLYYNKVKITKFNIAHEVNTVTVEGPGFESTYPLSFVIIKGPVL